MSKTEKLYLQLEEDLDDNAEELSDRELVMRSLQNPRFFEEFVNRYQDVFLRTVMRVLKKKEEAEEVVQAAFVKIYFNANKYKKQPGVAFKSWAFRILLNCAFTRYRKIKKGINDVEYLDQLLYLKDKNADLVFERKESRDEIDSILQKMPDGLSGLIREHYLEDRPYVEIASSQNMTVPALKMKLFRARKKFKEVSDDANMRI